jgi:hypothetical protein
MKVRPITRRIYLANIVIGSIGAIMLSLTTDNFAPTFGVTLFCRAVF